MRVLICDDHRLFAEPLGAMVQMRGHEVLVATSPTGMVDLVAEYRPDVCVVDLRFPEGSGIEAVRAVRERFPGCPVLVLTGSTDERDVAAARTAGAAGFLRKDQPTNFILRAIERVVAGGEITPPPTVRTRNASEAARVRDLLERLTAREIEVLHHLVRAEDTWSIARSLGVAPSTARTHLQNVLLKLGVHSRLQAVTLVVRAGVDGEL